MRGSECEAPGDVNNGEELDDRIWRMVRGLLLNAVTLCGSLSSVIRTKALLLMEHVLLRSSVCSKVVDAKIERYFVLVICCGSTASKDVWCFGVLLWFHSEYAMWFAMCCVPSWFWCVYVRPRLRIKAFR